MFAFIDIKKNKEGNNICPSLKEICKFHIRKFAAIKLDLLSEDKGYTPIFRPLLIINGSIRDDSFLKYSYSRDSKDKRDSRDNIDKKKFKYYNSEIKSIEWNPKLVSLLKSMTHDIPRTLQHDVNLKNPKY